MPMLSKAKFTLEELITLIRKSRAMQSFTEEEKRLIIEQSRDPESDRAQQLYKALIQEQQNYQMIEKDYIKNTNGIMANFENEVMDMKAKAMRTEREKAESSVEKKEKEAAQNILKSLM
ncbi:hypothetical protein KBB06_04365 [Candidatus Gracilibacteria bacterium]|nr:hypothetical protein [Candidatus Gracilibacteria bacterium]